ncbi:MAG TPA: hypothetical protein VJB56_00040 [Candidatus Paceibacterota bacterium]
MLRYLILVSSLVAILVAHSVAVENGYYNTFWWLDNVLHAAGGAWVAHFALIVFGARSRAQIVLFVFLCGGAWEILEFFLNTPFFGVNEANIRDPIWLLDTLTDLTVDVVAGFLFSLLIISKSGYNKTDV